MSQRMTMEEVLKEYGVPQIKLDVHATRSECEKLREKLIAIRNVSQAKEQGEIYAFPDDIKSYREEE